MLEAVRFPLLCRIPQNSPDSEMCIIYMPETKTLTNKKAAACRTKLKLQITRLSYTQFKCKCHTNSLCFWWPTFVSNLNLSCFLMTAVKGGLSSFFQCPSVTKKILVCERSNYRHHLCHWTKFLLGFLWGFFSCPSMLQILVEYSHICDVYHMNWSANMPCICILCCRHNRSVHIHLRSYYIYYCCSVLGSFSLHQASH